MENVIPISPRVASGVAGLDAVLGGGFPEASSVLLRGVPGAGKTTLGTQFVVAGILDHGQPGVIMSFETFPAHFYRDAGSFGWDLRAMEKEGKLRVLFMRRDDLYSSFAERESMAVSRLTDATIDIGATRLFIDGASRFFRLPLPPEQQLAVYQDFVLKAKGLNAVTMLALNTTPGAPAGSHPAEAGADVVVMLERDESDHPDLRVLTISRARGMDVQPGRHPFAITPGGIHVWRRHGNAPVPAHDAATETKRMPTGVPGLDDLLRGGFRTGSCVLVAGPGGSGKSLIAAAFARAAAAGGGGALLAHAAPPVDDRLREAGVMLCHADPANVAHPLEYLDRVNSRADEAKPAAIVLDGLPLLGTSAAAAAAWHCDVVQPLAARAAEAGAVLLVTAHLGSDQPVRAIAADAALQNFETILLAGYRSGDDAGAKQLCVVKARGGCAGHDPRPLLLDGGEPRLAGD